MSKRIRGRRWLTGLGLLAALGAVSLASSRAMQAKPAQSPAPQPPVLQGDPLQLPAKPDPGINSTEPALPHPPPEARDPAAPPAAAPKPAITEDPEGSAGEFLERSRREANEAVRALSTEAESLRARLARTEAGLKRWQGVLGALDAQAPGVPPAAAGSELKPANPGPGAPVEFPNEPPTLPEPNAKVPTDPGSPIPAPPAEPPPAPKSAG